MSILVDAATKKITLPRGDTGIFVVNLLDETSGVAPDPAITGTAKFAVCKPGARGKYMTVLYKDVNIADNAVTVCLTNADTENIDPGDYFWDVRIMTAPETDATNGAVETDAIGEVHSLFALTGMPPFVLKGDAVSV